MDLACMHAHKDLLVAWEALLNTLEWPIWEKNIKKKVDTCIRSDQISRSVVSNPMNRSTPGLPVHHQLLEFTQIPGELYNAIQPSQPLSSPSPPAFNLS